MKVTYAPKGDPEQTWDWDPDAVSVVEAEAIERRVDATWDEFRVLVMKGSSRARRVLLWHLLKREHPPLKLDDVDFRVGEVKVEMDRAELQDMRDRIAESKRLDEDERDKVLSALDDQIDKAPGGTATPPGKAPSKSAAASTPG